MKKTQFIQNSARLQGGKKSPKPREYERADDVYSPAKLSARENQKPLDCHEMVQVLNALYLLQNGIKGNSDKHD
jgi:hypothetical protein